VRGSVEQLHAAVLRGERFSSELERHDVFPPVVNQLVIVGEKTGTLARATRDIRTHLQREVQRHTNLLLGTIEPVLTIGLAICIGGILLAIYLPMFDMIGAMNNGPN
jgi:type II secretory pathway component PulF